MTETGARSAPASNTFALEPPAIALPKGGGAIRGIGEKFGANPVMGTGSTSIPIFTTPGRSGFRPALALTYDSGAGNGPFGFGWQLAIPAITRKTDKGIPRYHDDDVFLLAGVEDLVPELRDGAIGETTRGGYRVRRYRPRIEGLFARIERWTSAGDTFWRSISRDNVTTIYGNAAASRIADGDRTFSWLPCESFDDKGNAILYEYASEDFAGVDRGRGVNRYLKRIHYGNRTPTTTPSVLPRTAWMFEVVLDYGEGHCEALTPSSVRASSAASRAWSVRPDAFSSYRAGFEIRTYRRCDRILMFHRFAELGSEPSLVRSTELDYRDLESAPAVEVELAHPGSTGLGSFVQAITQRGYVRTSAAQTYLSKPLPPVTFAYSRATVADEIREIDRESLENLPIGLDGQQYKWVDLDGEGLAGLLTEQAGAWFYKRNISDAAPRLGPIERLHTIPSIVGGHQFLDLDGNGQLDVVQFRDAMVGYFERTHDGSWDAFRPFASQPTVALGDPNTKLVDLTGDGHADLFQIDDGIFTWYPSLTTRGFGAAEHVRQPLDEDVGPRLVFSDDTRSIYLADMSGDGLADLVRIQNGEVCYWPNLGYGRFGARITMADAPWFDAPDRFDHRRIRVADIDGSGTSDIIYLGLDRVSLYFNRCGNSFTAPRQLRQFPRVDDVATVNVVDLLGNGTACLVWSSPLTAEGARPMRYIDLMGGQKPHLLTEVDNNLGETTRVEYAPSTKFYLADKRAGTPWITRLPFPVHCVERVTITDRWRGTSFSTRYSYHHGYFDGAERELRGFGRVEQIDVERFSGSTITTEPTLSQAPVKTVTWYHTGAFQDRERILSQFESEYFRPTASNGFHEHALGDPEVSDPLTTDEWREALRACKGIVLRQEVYELATDGRHARLFSTASRNCRLQCLQPRGVNQHAVFLATENESLTYHYDLDLGGSAPDPRIAHTANVEIDRYGNVLQSIGVVYGRLGRHEDAALPETLIADVQKERHIAYTVRRFTSDVIDDDRDYRLPAPCEVLTYDVTGVVASGYLTIPTLRTVTASAVDRQYHESPTTGVEKRLVEHVRTLYFDDALAGPRSLGELGRRALTFETYKLALTDTLLSAVFDTKVAAVKAVLGTPRGGYLASAGQYWIRSGTAELDATRFYLPQAYVDAFGNRTELAYVHDLLVASRTDAIGNTVSVEAFDFRVLAATRVKDCNDNESSVAFDVLGMPTAIANLAAGDDLVGLAIDPTLVQVTDFFTGTYRESDAAALLQRATTRHLYYFGERIEPDGSTSWGHHPACATSIARERHVPDLASGGRLQTSFEYSDGRGAVMVQKVKAEPAPNASAVRWIANGRTIVNNKGKPVLQYEPYWSSNEHRFEELAAVGVTPIMYYDALGRLIRTELPDGSYSRVELSPWHVTTFDPNDTVGEVGNRWYEAHSASTATAEQRRAASLALAHANTPTLTILDSLGRDVIVVQHETTKHVTFTKLDAEGKPLWIRDARGNLVMQYIRPASPTGYTPGYDLAGNLLFQHSMDAGERWVLNDAAGKPMFGWDANERAGQLEMRFAETFYDKLHRPTQVWLRTNNGAAELIERIEYGEGLPNDRARNVRGRVHAHHDPSGLSTIVAYDDSGKPLEVTRRLASDYKAPRLDWQSATLEPETFTQITAYDALGRMTQLRSWHRPNKPGAIYEPKYNERGLLEREDFVLRASRTTAIAAITYDAKGQREAIRYGNGTQSRFTYDPKTFRLVQLRTTRPNYDPAFPSAVAQFKTTDVIQNLFYTYDAVGNITEIYDDAYKPAFFANAVIEPQARYTYDALYRLTSATGREHAASTPPAQLEGPPLAPAFPIPQGNPADQRMYTQRYRYDAVGNILELAHTTTGTGWTRHYEYAPTNNRLARTWLGSDTQNATHHAHDTHGNILNLENVSAASHLRWDHRDMIQALERIGGGRVYYQYDAGKQRTRKVSETQNGAKAWERIYLGGMEIYRRYDSTGIVEETETHHVFEGDHRVLLVEDVIETDRPRATLGALYRYQYTNHLGSSCLELDATAAVISYEEFHPYGTTAYRTARSQTEAPKRYRFTGMERDEESGLSYHTARYYAPWLARWTSSDPSGIADGLNLYAYTRGNPLRFSDEPGSQSRDKVRPALWDPDFDEEPLSGGVAPKDVEIVPTDEPPLKASEVAGFTGGPLGRSEFEPPPPGPQTTAKHVAGVVYGTVQTLAPGGFLMPSPAPDSRDFELGRAMGQRATGATMVITGGIGTIGGGGAAATGVGAPIGLPVMAVGSIATVNGGIGVLAGNQTIAAAMKLPDDRPAPAPKKEGPKVKTDDKSVRPVHNRDAAKVKALEDKMRVTKKVPEGPDVVPITVVKVRFGDSWTTYVVQGHHRFQAAKNLAAKGMSEFNTVPVKELSWEAFDAAARLDGTTAHAIIGAAGRATGF